MLGGGVLMYCLHSTYATVVLCTVSLALQRISQTHSQDIHTKIKSEFIQKNLLSFLETHFFLHFFRGIGGGGGQED